MEKQKKNRVTRDNGERKEWTFQLAVRSLVEHTFFKYFFITVAFCNCILIGFETIHRKERKYDTTFFVCEQVIFTIFLVEILLKLCSGFRIFWTNSWNVWDVMVTVAVTALSRILPMHDASIIFLRVIRSFRWLCHSDDDLIFDVAKKSLSPVTNIVLVISGTMLVFGLFGVLMFGDIVPSVFEDLSTALYSLFVCIFQDGWRNLYRPFQDVDVEYKYIAAVYFIVFILLGSFILRNFITSAIFSNVQSLEENGTSVLEDSASMLTSQDHIAAHVKEVMSKTNMTKRLRPKLSSDLQNLNIKMFKKNAVLRHAMYLEIEDNLMIQRRLKSILKEHQSIPQNRKLLQQMKQKEMAATCLKNILDKELATACVGDLLSTLITLEKEHMSDSKTGHLYTAGMFQEGVRRLSVAASEMTY